MTGRLAAIAAAIVPARVIADVGCDHGLIAKYCLDRSLCERVIASDVSEVCLDKARAALAHYDNVSFAVCDGIAYDCDEAVIAGMGGTLIRDIIVKAKRKPRVLVLCPHRNPELVRRALTEHGYSIKQDVLCKDRGKFYFVIRAETQIRAATELSELQYLFGVYYYEKCELLEEYLRLQYNTYMRAPERNAEKLALVERAMNDRRDA